jgi:hypothetical protein
MPIFSKPKSASLNPDKLPNKKVYERDKKRVKSGTPSANSKVDADTFTSLTQALEEVKNDLIRFDDLLTSFDKVKIENLEFGNILNLISKASNTLSKIQSSSITTSQQIELQDYADSINALFISFNDIYNDTTAQLATYQGRRQINSAPAVNSKKVSNFLDTILLPLRQFLTKLNSKLVASGNDANRKVPVEISGINAPPPVVVGAGFKTSYRLEKGAIQYQNQKYI